MILVLLPVMCTKQTAKRSVVAKSQGNVRGVTVEFLTRTGAYEVQAELAMDMASRERGLMFRHHLDPGKGMLFVFPRETVNTFWMKNTLIPLDMVFINKDLDVVGVVHNAKPLDQTPVGPNKPSMYVVEIPAGEARTHGIRAGTKVVFRPNPPPAIQ
jgi:uncharacterized membrane protein (UPF0127 family)